MWDYTEKLKELFLHPRNVGEIENPDATGEVGSIVCGDALKLTLRIERETNRIMDAKFQTFGCASAIASSSALTELIKGKTIDEALQITNQDIAEYLGGMPKEKMHCSVMGREALEAAVANYRGEAPPLETKEHLVCQCFEVSEEKIRRIAVENRLTTVEEITAYTKAGGGCGSCVPRIEEILKDLWSVKPPERPQERKRLTNLQKIALIQDVIEKEIRPRLQADGGDLELIDVEGNRVIIALRAMCVGCPMGGLTLESIRDKLRELVDEQITVEAG
jgi:NifU-like protein